MLYMSCTLCIYRSIANKQRFHRSLPTESQHTHRLVALDCRHSLSRRPSNLLRLG